MLLSFARYLMVVGGVIVLVVGGVGVTNGIVNPYGFYPRLGFMPDVFPQKTETTRHTRMIKAQQIRLTPPTHVILGSSRAEYGINPDDRTLPENVVIYNAALPGTNLYELTRMFDHALAAGSLRTAIIALDFFMFDDDLPIKPDFDETRFLVLPDGTTNPHVSHDLATLVSIDTFFDSLRTVLRQNTHSGHTAHGFRPPTDRAAELRALGPTGIMARVRADFLKRARPSVSMVRAFAQLDTMLDRAARHNIRIALVLAPLHRTSFDNLRDAGQGAAFSAWRSHIHDTAARRGLVLMDWTDIAGISDEPVPTATDGRMIYFWESVHYTPVIGSMILKALAQRDFFSAQPTAAGP